MDQMDPMNRGDVNRFDQKKMRKGLKAHDEIELPMTDDFFDRLHDKIMSEVEKVEIAPPPRLMSPRHLLRVHLKGWLYPTGGLMSLMLFSFMMMNQVSKVNQSMVRVGLLSDGHERIVTEALLSPEDLAQTLISTQSDSDFFMDVAGESFENLSVAKFNKIMGESGR